MFKRIKEWLLNRGERDTHDQHETRSGFQSSDSFEESLSKFLEDHNTSSVAKLFDLNHSDRIVLSYFSLDCSRIYTHGDDGLVLVWDTLTGKNVETFEVYSVFHAGKAQLHGDYVLLSSPSYRQAMLNDINSFKSIASIGCSYSRLCSISSASFNRSGDKILITTSHKGDIEIWPKGEEDDPFSKETVTFEHGRPDSAVFFDNDNYVLTSGFDKQLMIWNAATGEPDTVCSYNQQLMACRANEKGDRFLATVLGGGAKKIVVFARDGKLLYELDHDSDRFIAFFDGGYLILASTEKSEAELYTSSDGKLSQSIKHIAGLAPVVYKNSHIITCIDTRVVGVHHIHTGQCIVELPHQEPITQLTLSPCKRFLLVLQTSGMATVWYLGHLTSDAISTIEDLSTWQESSFSDSSSETDDHFQKNFQANCQQRLKQVIEGFNNKKKVLKHNDAQAIENALYFAEKYMSKRACKRSKRSYITGLIKDIDKAKYEFSETCYDNDYASDVFQQLKLHLAGMLADED